MRGGGGGDGQQWIPSRNVKETESTDLDVDEREGRIKTHCQLSRMTSWVNGVAFRWERVHWRVSHLEEGSFEFTPDSGCRRTAKCSAIN